MSDETSVEQQTKPATAKGLDVALQSLRTDTLDLPKRIQELKASANQVLYDLMEEHLAEMVQRLQEKGLNMGPKGAEFSKFDLNLGALELDSHPSMYVDIYLGDNNCLQLYLAAFGAPWDGCIKLQQQKPSVSRREAWIIRGQALEYVKKWDLDRRGDRVIKGLACLSGMSTAYGSFTSKTVEQHCKWCNEGIAKIVKKAEKLEAQIVDLEKQLHQAQRAHDNLGASMNA